MWRRVQQHRRGQDIEEAQDTGLDADDVPDDAMVALELLRAQFPQSDVVGVRPVILVSQLYSLVKDRTTVDRQLDKAMRLQEIRLFRMVGHATDNLAMAADDYEAAARRAVEVYASKRKSGSRSSGAGKHARREISHGRAFGADSGSDEDEDVQGFGRATGRNDSGDCVAGPGKGEILERFLYGVLPEHPRVSISAFDLTGSIAAARCAPEGASSSQGNQTNTAQAGVAASGIKSAWNRGALRQLSASESQDAVTFLDNAGLLIRKDGSTYLFAVPGIGLLQGQILQGRQELLKMMGRKKFGEVLMRDAEKMKLKSSALGARFHLRDLIGRGNVEVKATTAGPMAKVITGTSIA